MTNLKKWTVQEWSDLNVFIGSNVHVERIAAKFQKKTGVVIM
jgi:hypothetical protein